MFSAPVASISLRVMTSVITGVSFNRTLGFCASDNDFAPYEKDRLLDLLQRNLTAFRQW